MTERTFHRDYVPLAETLYRIAFYMLESRAEAEDAVQELFLKLWETRDRLDEIQSPKAYSIRLLKNLCLHRIRQVDPDEGRVFKGVIADARQGGGEFDLGQRALGKGARAKRLDAIMQHGAL